MYYLRTKPAATANQFTVDKTKLNKNINTETNGAATNGTSNDEKKDQQAFNMNAMVCSLKNKDDCLMCGS